MFNTYSLWFIITVLVGRGRQRIEYHLDEDLEEGLKVSVRLLDLLVLRLRIRCIGAVLAAVSGGSLDLVAGDRSQALMGCPLLGVVRWTTRRSSSGQGGVLYALVAVLLARSLL